MASSRTKLREAILLALEKASDGAVAFADFYDNPRRFVWYGPRDLPKSKLSLTISRLRKKGYIEKYKDQSKIILKLTQLGQDLLLKHLPEDNYNWDGIWRLVIFDIPESQRRIRNILRRRLKEWGFNQWQKSVWATKKPLTEALRSLVKQLEVEDWVLVIETDNVGRNIKFLNDRINK